MSNIVLIGGMASGKTTLAKKLVEIVPDARYIPMNKYAVGIPFSLIPSPHNLLSLSKQDYIEKIIENKDIEIDWSRFNRKELNEYVQEILDTYGEEVCAELALAAIEPEVSNIVDNVPKTSNIRYLKDKGFYIVGLTCSFETQVQRRLSNPRDIDPSGKSLLEEQITQTNAFFDIENTLQLAHVRYDTDAVPEQDYPLLVERIVEATQ